MILRTDLRNQEIRDANLIKIAKADIAKRAASIEKALRNTISGYQALPYIKLNTGNIENQRIPEEMSVIIETPNNISLRTIKTGSAMCTPIIRSPARNNFSASRNNLSNTRTPNSGELRKSFKEHNTQNKALDELKLLFRSSSVSHDPFEKLSKPTPKLSLEQFSKKIKERKLSLPLELKTPRA